MGQSTEENGENLLLSLPEIASWQIDSTAATKGTTRASLPALQRGAVWKFAQIEALWDSFFRGFPVGSFLLSHYDDSRGKKKGLYSAESPSSDDLTHHILDGQQRANGIALGFFNQFSKKNIDASASLWIDLEPPENNDDRFCIFRVTTKPHPWGYGRDLTKEDLRLSMPERRAAHSAFSDLEPKLKNAKHGETNLCDAWPWDARKPFPLTLLIESISNEESHHSLLERCAQMIPYWNAGHAKTKYSPCWKEDAKRIFSDTHQPENDFIGAIRTSIKRILKKKEERNGYRIPAIILPMEALSASPIAHDTSTARERSETGQLNKSDVRQDPIETLFIRINSGGTKLEGEELIYSILKSIWPEAQELVESAGNKFVTPSRVVVLSARLVLAEQDYWKTNYPPQVTVRLFRSLIHGLEKNCTNFRELLLKFLKDPSGAEKVFELARTLLTEERSTGKSSFALPKILASDLASKSVDAVFLALRVAHRCSRESKEPFNIEVDVQRKFIGAITTLAWFSTKTAQCVAALWPVVQKDADPFSFLKSTNFSKCFHLHRKTQKPMLIVPIQPKALRKIIQNATTEAPGFHKATSNLWKKWSWHNNLANLDTRRTGLTNWYDKTLHASWKPRIREEQINETDGFDDDDGENDNDEVFDTSQIDKDSWSAFINRLRSDHNFVLYAQRAYLKSSFSKFDPTSLTHLDETELPWDMDHIHPKSFLSGKRPIPILTTEWHSSIGNLRAWPFEYNRSDSNATPREKLCSEDSRRFKEICLQSSIKWNDRTSWIDSCPDSESFPRYLAKTEYRRNWESLLCAITSRFIDLYEEWYNALEIEALLVE